VFYLIELFITTVELYVPYRRYPSARSSFSKPTVPSDRLSLFDFVEDVRETILCAEGGTGRVMSEKTFGCFGKLRIEDDAIVRISRSILKGVQTVEKVLLAFTFKRTWHKQDLEEGGKEFFFGEVRGLTWREFYSSAFERYEDFSTVVEQKGIS
jgi:metal-sulfur cluster biosynthetic enzyme